jgi:hypothetical protein
MTVAGYRISVCSDVCGESVTWYSLMTWGARSAAGTPRARVHKKFDKPPTLRLPALSANKKRDSIHASAGIVASEAVSRQRSVSQHLFP